MSKIELSVYSSNTAAIALYRRFGFTDFGMVRDHRRLDGVSYDVLLMELTTSSGF
jgi:RimJ/RimL family protein N-acetyltransferase